jgi:RNA polymerase sigma-70 factor (ECF subfamily)
LSDDDEQLLVEAAQRDPAQFAALYDLNFDRVYAFIARRVGNRSVAEDITAEVFHRALANLKKFEWRGKPFIAWLYRIAWNQIIDHAKRSSREAELTVEPTHEEMEEVERRAMLFQMVDTLPDAQRDVIIKRFAEDRSIADVALEMGRSEGAIKQLQFRALESLRRNYA